MGELVDYHKLPRRARKIVTVPPTGARILFFTGVRYQRWAQDDGAAHMSDLPDALPTDPKPTTTAPGGSGRSRRRHKRA